MAEAPAMVSLSEVMTKVGMWATREKRPLASKRARKPERSKYSPSRGTMPPLM
jgi:hypothetical protein